MKAMVVRPEEFAPAAMRPMGEFHALRYVLSRMSALGILYIKCAAVGFACATALGMLAAWVNSLI